MNKKYRARAIWGAVALVGTAVAIACGGDDDSTPTIDAGTSETGTPDGSVADSTPNTNDTGPSDAGIQDAPPGQNLDAPGDEIEASTRQDAAVIEAGAACLTANQCDCDNDGYQADTDACAGNDCDDRDGLVHPNQNYVIEPPTPPNQGNWDCKQPIEKQYVTNLNCAALLGLGCNATAQGFLTDPGCGVEADYYQCQPVLLGCTANLIGKRRQGCK